MNTKNQVVLPSLLRDAFFNMEEEGPLQFYAEDDQGGPVEIYPPSVWRDKQQLMADKAREIGNRMLSLIFNSRAKPVDLPRGGNGRLLVPKELAERYRPSNEILFVGNFTKIEMWVPEEFEAEMARNMADMKSAYETIRG